MEAFEELDWIAIVNVFIGVAATMMIVVVDGRMLAVVDISKRKIFSPSLFPMLVLDCRRPLPPWHWWIPTLHWIWHLG